MNPLDKSAIYGIACSFCSAQYIGKTGRKIINSAGTQNDQCQIYKIRGTNSDSSFANHNNNCHDSLNIGNDLKILYYAKKRLSEENVRNFFIKFWFKWSNSVSLNIFRLYCSIPYLFCHKSGRLFRMVSCKWRWTYK